MKKLLTIVFTMLLAGSLSYAQNTGGDKAAHKGTKTEADAASKDTKTAKKAHKGGKKSKKNSGESTTPPPK